MPEDEKEFVFNKNCHRSLDTGEKFISWNPSIKLTWKIHSFITQKVWECNQCLVASREFGEATPNGSWGGDAMWMVCLLASADAFKAFSNLSLAFVHNDFYAILRDITSFGAFNLLRIHIIAALFCFCHTSSQLFICILIKQITNLHFFTIEHFQINFMKFEIISVEARCGSILLLRIYVFS